MSFDFVENFTLELPDLSKTDINFSESFNSSNGLIIEVAAIHEGLTANYNNYSADALEKALESWVSPYPKPIILNHDLNTEPIGRVMAAKMDKEEDGTSFVRLQIAITDPVAIEKVMDKRYLTGSVGGRAGRAMCSISGEDLAQETESGRPRVPKYRRGKVYKGKLAYIDMQDISFKEYSFVNQPADQRSSVKSARKADGDAPVAASDDWVAKSSAFVLHMDSEDIISIEENESILSNLKKKESRPTYLQIKGAFLTALAVQESENGIYEGESLLCNEDLEKINPEECSEMAETNKEDDILAVAEGLSEDLSNLASASNAEESVKEESVVEDIVQEDVAEDNEVVEASEESTESSVEEGSDEALTDEVKADEAQADEDLTSPSEEAEVQDVDSEKAEELDGTSEESEDSKDDIQEEAAQEEALTAEESSDEQVLEELNSKIELLESELSSLKDENSKLKGALHMTLVERVVDTKIALGIVQSSSREELIKEHAPRTASSLADSLRDLATLPSKTASRLTTAEFDVDVDDVAVSVEKGVATIDPEEKEDNPNDSFEQVLVDTLMGRRKL